MKILLTDDSDEFRKAIADGLKVDEGLSITQASNGLEGFMLCKRHLYDVLITDWQMPDMDGGQLISNVKQRQPNIKTVLISTAKLDEEDWKSMGADAYVRKDGDIFPKLNLVITELVG